MTSSDGLQEVVDNEDYYSLLNASREASAEELKLSYRRLCKQYHPDKHIAQKRRDAAEIFNKIQVAYDVLSDTNKRYIYDVYGKTGLDADWQIIERKKTPQEIHEEYERIQRRKEMQKLEERTHPEGTFAMHIDATSIFDDVSHDDDYLDVIVLPEITKMSLSQSVQAPLTVSKTATISGILETKNGNGRGDLSLAFRQIISPKSWAEMSIGASDSRFMSFGLRGYRTFGKGIFATAHIPLSLFVNESDIAVSLPGFTTAIGRPLGEHTVGTLEWTCGHVNHLSTSLLCETSTMQIFGRVRFGIPHSYVYMRFYYKIPQEKVKAKVSFKIGTFGYLFEFGAEHQLSQFSTVSANVAVGIPFGVRLKLRLNRASQNYFIPIVLSDEINPAAILYATVVPTVIYFAIHKLCVQPYLKRKKKEEEESVEHKNSAQTTQMREESARMILLMKESTERKIEMETQKSGLIISEAWYGKLVNEIKELSSNSRVIDVRVPLQNIVENSKLQLPKDISKEGIAGFYDPCPGSEKLLKVIYRFRNKMHQVIIGDKDQLRIPLKSHLIENNEKDE